MKTRFGLALLVFCAVVSGCKWTAPFLVVTVRADPAVSGVVRVEVTVTHGSASATVPLPVGSSGSAITFPKSVTLELPAGTVGAVNVHADGKDSTGAVIVSGNLSSEVIISGNGETDVSVTLGLGGGGDLGVSSCDACATGGCCGSTCAPAHVNGLDPNGAFFSCEATGANSAPLAMAACMSWTERSGPCVSQSGCFGFDLCAMSVGGKCGCWAFAGDAAGYASVAASCMCAGKTTGTRWF